MALTAAEQYLLELINRARLDPAAEAKRYGVSLNSGLSSGTIDTDAKQVLAHNTQLETAAMRHSKWMLDRDVFSHSGSGGSDPGDRMADAGYKFSGSWTWRENLAWTGTTGNVNMSRAVADHHEGLYRSAGHRANTFAEDVREIGIAQVSGKFNYQGTNFNASMLTEKFAKSGSDVFVTGVAYRDGDGDRFYDIGEGRGNYFFRGGGDSERSADAGGYALDVGTSNAVTVSFGHGKSTYGQVRIDTSDGNAKLDLIVKTNGQKALALSGSADIKYGVSDARLLGVADLDLSGANSNDILRGNTGDNLIQGERGSDRVFGSGGNDRLEGEGGQDMLYGGYGNDRLFGGGGDDVLRGEAGWDRLHGGAGEDRLLGGDKADILRGNAGRDVLYGEAGNDDLWGGAHWDRLYGGSGNDRLDGSFGNDWLYGGGGSDTFVFKNGQDIIKDFQDNVDTIAVGRYVSGTNNVAGVLDQGRIVNGDAVFDFDNGARLTVEGVTDLDILANDLTFV